MKITNLILIAIGLFVSQVVQAQSVNGLTVDDLDGGYILAKEVNSPAVVQLELRKIPGSTTAMEIVSLLEGSRTRLPKVVCEGQAGLRDGQIRFFFECDGDQYGSGAPLPKGKVDLKKGFKTTFMNRRWVITKSEKPYFRILQRN